MNGCEDVGPWAGRPRAEMMKSDEVEAMLHLHALSWGLKRIARDSGAVTVRRYVAADGWMAYSRPVRGGKLEAQEAWLKECFFRHRGNAEVVRQDLLRELSIDVSLRTLERAVAPFRRLLTAEAKATVRFETYLGHQLQIHRHFRRTLDQDVKIGSRRPVTLRHRKEGTDRASSLRSDERSRSPESAFTFAEIAVHVQRNTHHFSNIRRFFEGSVFGVAGGSIPDVA